MLVPLNLHFIGNFPTPYHVFSMRFLYFYVFQDFPRVSYVFPLLPHECRRSLTFPDVPIMVLAPSQMFLCFSDDLGNLPAMLPEGSHCTSGDPSNCPMVSRDSQKYPPPYWVLCFRYFIQHQHYVFIVIVTQYQQHNWVYDMISEQRKQTTYVMMWWFIRFWFLGL